MAKQSTVVAAIPGYIHIHKTSDGFSLTEPVIAWRIDVGLSPFLPLTTVEPIGSSGLLTEGLWALQLPDGTVKPYYQQCTSEKESDGWNSFADFVAYQTAKAAQPSAPWDF